jgi:thiol-disulfide isomerase/thioredoxin
MQLPLLLLVVRAQLYDETPDAHFVKLLTPFVFNHHVLRSRDTVWVIKFYAPTCPHCVRMAPDFKRASVELEKEAAAVIQAAASSGSASAAASARLRVRVGAMDGQRFSGFSQAYQIAGFPTVLGFLPAKLRTPKTQHPLPMAGLGGWESVVAFAKKLHEGAAKRQLELQGAAPDPRKSKLCPQLVPEELYAFSRGRHPSSGGAAVAVLFLGSTEDPEPPEWLSYLAIKLKKGAAKRAALGYFAAPASHAIASSFGVGEQLPAVVVISEVEEFDTGFDEAADANGDEERGDGSVANRAASSMPPLRTVRFARFAKTLVCAGAKPTGDADCERARREALFDFIDAFAKHPDVFKTEAMPALPRAAGAAPPREVAKLTEETEDERCLGLHRSKHKKRSLCVLLFTTETGGSVASGEDGPAENQGRRQMSKEHALLLGLSTKYATDPFVFSFVRLDEQPEFAEAFGISPAAAPALVVLKTGKRNRFAKLQLDHDVAPGDAAAEAFLEGVLGGNARFKRLTELPRVIEELLDELPREADTPSG